MVEKDLSEADELRWMSLAYYDAGIHLARSIVDDDFSSSVHRDLVPIFLVHQALELMLKSALKIRTGAFPKSHSLEKLYEEFAVYYPNFKFKIPKVLLAPKDINFSVLPELELPHVVQHERLRYPTDKNDNPWSVAEEINLSESFEELDALAKSMYRIWNIINEHIENA